MGEAGVLLTPVKNAPSLTRGVASLRHTCYSQPGTHKQFRPCVRLSWNFGLSNCQDMQQSGADSGMKSKRINKAPKEAKSSAETPPVSLTKDAEIPPGPGTSGLLRKVAAGLLGTALILAFYLAWQSAAGKAINWLPLCHSLHG